MANQAESGDTLSRSKPVISKFVLSLLSLHLKINEHSVSTQPFGCKKQPLVCPQSFVV